MPRIELGSATVYLAGRQRLYCQEPLVLNGLPDPLVNEATVLTNVVPEYAPPAWHLLAARVLDSSELETLLPSAQRFVPCLGLLDRDSALDSPELRQFFARAAPDLDLDLPEVRAELRQHVRLPTAAIAELRRLVIGSGAAACRVRVPTLILQGQADRIVRPHDTRLLAGQLGGAVYLHELVGGHLLLDPTTSACEHVRELIVRFVGP